LQREDIHPLEEAFGFRSLLNLNDRTTLSLLLQRERERAKPMC
jgi:hypothetical protein